jgi:hypothetical protein
MLDWLKRFFYKLLFKHFGYSRPLPPDEEVKAEIARLIALSKAPEDAQIERVQTYCCVYYFDEGGSACAVNIRDQGTCDHWGDWWLSKGRAGTPHEQIGGCPPGSTVYHV